MQSQKNKAKKLLEKDFLQMSSKQTNNWGLHSKHGRKQSNFSMLEEKNDSLRTYLFFWPLQCGLWDLSSPTRDQTRAFDSKSTES